MRHFATPHFWARYRELPEEFSGSQIAVSSYCVLILDTPSLHLKKVGKPWSARVGLMYCALAVEEGANLVCFWIGSHDEYDRRIHKR